MILESPITEYVDAPFLNVIPSNTTIGEAGQKMIELSVDSTLVLEGDQISGKLLKKIS